MKIDRKYGSVTLSHPLLTFGICAQPQVLNNVISNQHFIGKGLTQRFLFCLPNSMIGHRKLIQDINGTEVTKKYQELIYRLLNMPPNPDQCIELTCKATDLFTAYADKIEFQMSENEALADRLQRFFQQAAGQNTSYGRITSSLRTFHFGMYIGSNNGGSYRNIKVLRTAIP